MRLFKRLLGVGLVTSALVTSSAFADACGAKLTGVFTSAQAVQMCKTFGGSGSLIPSVNDTYDVGSSALQFNEMFAKYFVSSQTGGTLISSTGETAVPAGVTAVAGQPRLYVGTAGNAINAITMAAWGAVVNGNNIDMYKTRAASSGAPTTIVGSTDILGSISFYGASGTAYASAARIQARVNGTPGASNDMPGLLEFQTSPDGSATPAAVLTLGQDKSAQFTGTIRSSATADLGWSIVNAANQACNTTCTSACVAGIDTAAVGPFLSCATATADSCICAGAS